MSGRPPITKLHSRADLCSCQHPHEEELDNVRVKEEKLGSLIALRSRVGLHGRSSAAGVFRQ